MDSLLGLFCKIDDYYNPFESIQTNLRLCSPNRTLVIYLFLLLFADSTASTNDRAVSMLMPVVCTLITELADFKEMTCLRVK